MTTPSPPQTAPQQASSLQRIAMDGGFWLFAWILTLSVARQFFGSMHDQLFLSAAAEGRPGATAAFSAPLDDVFIHFDFARAAARGFPFQWSEGNGYSSGGTSLLYPLVLAFGYRFGYRGTNLMLWAGIVACISVFGTMLLTRRMTNGLGRLWAFLPPLLLLSVGGLNWSLFSGMEVAVFLLVWATCYVFWDNLTCAVLAQNGSAKHSSTRHAAWLGAACAVLVGTRPESAVLVMIFALTSVAINFRRLGLWPVLRDAALIGSPAALVLVAHALANRWFTGEWSAAGSVAKLELNSPFLSRAEVWDSWLQHFKYQLARVTYHHFGNQIFEMRLPGAVLILASGLVIWALALASLIDKRTRRVGTLLGLSWCLYTMAVAFNGQVRWQNERYTMPAVAWLLLAAGLGAASLLEAASAALFKRVIEPARRKRALFGGLAALAGLLVFLGYQRAQYRDQVWFFGRASRNISDQQVTTGRLLRTLRASRVLVGDAGAIPYMSDLPALDLIGLGGYHDLPFARATRLGVAAGIELLQRLPKGERPDVLAIYPSWWGLFPMWFGERITSVPVRGNVICGAVEKVIYRANFESLDGTDRPTSLGRHDLVHGEVDFADLVSERSARVRFSGTPGFVTMRLLPHPLDPKRDLWDAGRILPQGASATFLATTLIPHEEAKLVLRIASSQPAILNVTLGNAPPLMLRTAPSGGWQEVALTLPRASVRESNEVTLFAAEGETVVYHLWLVQAK